MSSQVYNLSIRTPEDIDTAFADNTQVQQKISTIQKLKYVFDVEKTANDIALGTLFKNAYSCSLGFPACPEIVKELASYRALLTESLQVCKNLTPVFIRTFLFHQIALQAYVIDKNLSRALSVMSDIGKMAGELRGHYNTLHEQFDALRKKQIDIVTLISESDTETCIQLKKSHDQATISVLAATSSSLASATRSFFKIYAAISDASTLWDRAARHAKNLTNPDLADEDMVSMMESLDAAANDTLRPQLKTMEDAFDASMQQPPKVKNLTDVVRTMRTGRGVVPTPPKGMKFAALLDFDGGVAGEYNNSILEWLTLAKVNQTMIKALDSAIDDLALASFEISRLEQHPLVQALHASAAHL